jgi:glycosyltransferase involved in cell wall biosynthesis
MRILHTEASTGWGGQEMRILQEAEGMRQRGHEIVMINVLGGMLAIRARQSGFTVYELPMNKWNALSTLYQIIKIILKHNIDIVNTHSSFDAWLGGIAARLTGRKIIRTRHLSTPIRPGANLKILYHWLADRVVTTCASTAEIIQRQLKILDQKCLSIPTGIQPSKLEIDESKTKSFRSQFGLKDSDCLIGTTCILRSWKGLNDFLETVKLLEHERNLKWIIVGDGPMSVSLKERCQQLGLQDHVIFTGHLENPYVAMSSMDIFMLLSTANEAVSQASLQASFLQKPLITTNISGLSEVCLEGKTGFLVPIKSPQEIAKKILILSKNINLRQEMGREGKQHVLKAFTMTHTLDAMEAVYLYRR